MKNLTRPCAAGKYLPPKLARYFLDGRGGQGIKEITRNISNLKMTLKTFYVPLFFKPIECMDTIRVFYFLHYEPMTWILYLKPSFFCGNKPSLYSYNIVGILIKLFRVAILKIIITLLSLAGSFE